MNSRLTEMSLDMKSGSVYARLHYFSSFYSCSTSCICCLPSHGWIFDQRQSLHNQAFNCFLSVISQSWTPTQPQPRLAALRSTCQTFPRLHNSWIVRGFAGTLGEQLDKCNNLPALASERRYVPSTDQIARRRWIHQAPCPDSETLDRLGEFWGSHRTWLSCRLPEVVISPQASLAILLSFTSAYRCIRRHQNNNINLQINLIATCTYWTCLPQKQTKSKGDRDRGLTEISTPQILL